MGGRAGCRQLSYCCATIAAAVHANQPPGFLASVMRHLWPLVVLTGSAYTTLRWVLSASRAAAAARVAAEQSRAEAQATARLRRDRSLRLAVPRRSTPSAELAETLSRRKEDFLGLLSHELRNPLSAIHTALAVMRSRPGIHAGQHARAVVERQVSHIARLVDDLVDTARVERGTLSLQLESIDLRDVLRTAVDMAEPSIADREQDLLWTPAPTPMLVNGDRVRLQQVFSNLLLNASKYTPRRGEIALQTYREGSDVCVSVRDNGRGIPAEDLSKVFEPYVRAARDEPGLGVGLYVARTLIEQHGGEITVASEGSHKGATFTVRLPELSPLLQQM